MTRRPTAAELAGAAARRVPDVVCEDLDVLFCGINPGLYSAAVGHHFARPGNRFFKLLQLSGFTEVVLEPEDDRLLLGAGLGVTNLVERASASAAELSAAELRAGAARLCSLAERFRPRSIAVLGVLAYRTAFGRPRAGIGRQEERIGPAPAWVLPNPSGLQARYQLPELASLFGELRLAARPGECDTSHV